jgi:hypothetical protein
MNMKNLREVKNKSRRFGKVVTPSLAFSKSSKYSHGFIKFFVKVRLQSFVN